MDHAAQTRQKSRAGYASMVRAGVTPKNSMSPIARIIDWQSRMPETPTILATRIAGGNGICRSNARLARSALLDPSRTDAKNWW